MQMSVIFSFILWCKPLAMSCELVYLIHGLIPVMAYFFVSGILVVLAVWYWNASGYICWSQLQCILLALLSNSLLNMHQLSLILSIIWKSVNEIKEATILIREANRLTLLLWTKICIYYSIRDTFLNKKKGKRYIS